MQLNSATDYAVQITIYLAGLNEITNAAEISKTLGIPRAYVPKVLRGLIRSGIIASKEGLGGGYYLGKHPGDVTLLDIYMSCEPTTKISRCLEDTDGSPRHRTENYRIMDYYLELQNEIKERLQSKTIEAFL